MEGEGGTLEEGPRGCCKRLCLTEWMLRVVLSWCLRHLCGTLRVKLFPFVSTYIPGTHLAIVEHGIYPLAYYLRTSALPETSVSCLLSLPITLEGWPGPRTATPLPPKSFRDFQQTFSLPLPDFSHTNNKRWFLKQNLELSNAQAGMGVLQSGKAL